MLNLKNTINLMTSADYKERFVAEYHQLETRYLKLRDMCEKWDKELLDFEPTCPREWYNRQMYFMLGYLESLINRAKVEQVKLDIEQSVLVDVDNFIRIDAHIQNIIKS